MAHGFYGFAIAKTQINADFFVISTKGEIAQVFPQSESSIFVEFLVRFLVPRNDKIKNPVK